MHQPSQATQMHISQNTYTAHRWGAHTSSLGDLDGLHDDQGYPMAS